MKTEAAGSSKALVPIYKTTRCQITEYDLYFFTLQIYCFRIKYLIASGAGHTWCLCEELHAERNRRGRQNSERTAECLEAHNCCYR
jgi:hypothetical protein